jgi:DNA-directed RNA polymerase III subunit RPC3
MPNILNAYQRRTLDSIIENKFGSDALRVYRLLATKRKLEQKNISDFALIPMSRTKELLWAMFGGGLVIRQVCSNKHRSEQTALD